LLQPGKAGPVGAFQLQQAVKFFAHFTAARLTRAPVRGFGSPQAIFPSTKSSNRPSENSASTTSHRRAGCGLAPWWRAIRRCSSVASSKSAGPGEFRCSLRPLRQGEVASLCVENIISHRNNGDGNVTLDVTAMAAAFDVEMI
jgi:hypothetical protein